MTQPREFGTRHFRQPHVVWIGVTTDEPLQRQCQHLTIAIGAIVTREVSDA
jgi:hypothetical protein